MERATWGTEQFVIAPPDARRVLQAGAAVIAAGAAVWLIASAMIAIGSNAIQLVQSAGGATGLGGTFTLAGSYVLPFALLGVAAGVVGAGYLLYALGLTWSDPRSGSTVGFRVSRSKAVTLGVLFFVYGFVAIAIVPLLSSAQGLIAWLIASVLLVAAASRRFGFLRDLRVETGVRERLGGRGLRAFSKVGLVGLLLFALPVLLYAYTKPSPAGTAGGLGGLLAGFVLFASPWLYSFGGLFEFFVLPLLGVAVFGLMIPGSMRLAAVGRPPVVRVTAPAAAPSEPVGAIRPKPARISPVAASIARAMPENPSAPFPAPISAGGQGEESWVLNLQAEIASLEKALDAQKDSLSQLDQALRSENIERGRVEAMEQPGRDRIADLEREIAERRQRLPKDKPENP